MISYLEIESESSKVGVSPQTIEKDYHLDWYLAGLAKENFFSKFSFYGGTAIKKIYIPNHRFSEDIDLISSDKLSSEAIVEILGRAHKFLEKEANLFYSYRPDEIQIVGTQTRFLIHYRGFSEIGGIKRFLLDFAQGIEELPKPVHKNLITSYRDLTHTGVKISVWPLEIICAEKLALIVDRKRKEPRDIYDLWSILTQVKDFDQCTFLSRFKKTLSYAIDFSIIRSSFKDTDFENAWGVRLKHQVPNLPEFHVVVLALAEKLEKIWKKDQK